MSSDKEKLKFVSDRIRKFRIKSKWTKSDIAFYLGVSLDDYNDLEKGKSALLLKHMTDLASLYMILEYDFFDETITVDDVKVAIKIGTKEDMKTLSNFYKVIQNYKKMTKLVNIN